MERLLCFSISERSFFRVHSEPPKALISAHFYAKIERLSFNAFNEATDFFSAVEGYRQEHGCYPQRILVDKIYRNRETISWCKAQGVQLTGPALGRPAKNTESLQIWFLSAPNPVFIF